VKRQIVSLLLEGKARANACAEAGVSRATFYRWLKKDKRFAREVAEAEELAVMLVEDALYLKAIKGDVRAMIFFLTNKRPERWKAEGATIHEEDRKIIFEIVDANAGNKVQGNENI